MAAHSANRPSQTNQPPGPSCRGSRKRKQPDEDEQTLPREQPLAEQQIENEYEHLDDNEDDDEAPPKLRQGEFEQIMSAQEPATIKQYDDIKVIPFNLEEELEEGNFDQAGNFIFRKKEPANEEEDDTWAESVDWKAVEKMEREGRSVIRNSPAATTSKNQAPKAQPVVKDKLSCYKEMLRIMKSDETIQKCIRRLGNGVPKRRPYKKNSKPEPEEGAEVMETRRKLDLMIELAHQRVEDGDMDIYQKSYEDLEDAIN